MIQKKAFLFSLVLWPVLFADELPGPLQDLHRSIHDTEQHDHDRNSLVAERERALSVATSDEVRVEIWRAYNVEMGGRLANGQAMINAYQSGMQSHSMLEMTRELIRPRTALALSLGALGIFAAWHGTVLMKNMLSRWMRVPALAQKTSIKSWFGPRTEEKIALQDVVLEQQLQERMEQLTDVLKNRSSHQGNLRHFLFYGPSGVGKTMLGMAIAQQVGLDYIYFSAAKLELYSLKEGLKRLVHLCEYAQSSSKKLIIVLDEAEVLFGKREIMSDKTRKLLDTLLTYMGTETPHFMVIAITNKPAEFDTAALSRFGEKIRIGPPAFDERRKILLQYGKKYLTDMAHVMPDNRNPLQKMLSTRPVRLPLHGVPDALSEEFLDEILLKLDGFVGRDIADIMLAVQGAAYASKDRTVTRMMLSQAVDTKIAQKQAEKNGFAEQIG